MTNGPTPDDEGRQRPGASPDWCEWTRFEWSASSTAPGGWVVVTVLPNQRRSVVGVAVGGPHDFAMIAADDLPLPSPADTWELRGPGIWLDVVCEAPLDHWSVGLEAFAVGLDDPAQVDAEPRGVRVPLGLELTSEDQGSPRVVRTAPLVYRAESRVVGEVLWGTDRFPLDGPGQRERGVGLRPPPGSAGVEGLRRWLESQPVTLPPRGSRADDRSR